PARAAGAMARNDRGQPAPDRRARARDQRLRTRAAAAQRRPRLLGFLTARADIIVEQISDDEIDVSLLGSYNADAMRMQLYLLIRAWEAAHAAQGTVEIQA